MAKEHDEIRSLLASTGWKIIEEGVEARKKVILKEMLDASVFAGLPSETLDENARKQLYKQHLLKMAYMYLDLIKGIPQAILNAEIPSGNQVEEYLSSFDQKYL